MDESVYQENILDHYRWPRNYGKLAKPSFSHRENNAVCGDYVEIQAKVSASGTIEEIKFTGEGCAISKAAASMLTEFLKGKPLSDLEKFSSNDMVSLLGITPGPARLKCALLALKAAKLGLCVYENKKPDPESESI